MRARMLFDIFVCDTRAQIEKNWRHAQIMHIFVYT